MSVNMLSKVGQANANLAHFGQKLWSTVRAVLDDHSTFYQQYGS